MWARRDRLAAESGVRPEVLERLIGRYGDLVTEVLGFYRGPDGSAALVGAPNYLSAEIAYAVTHEGARHLDDVLVRRTRIAMETPDRGCSVAAEVAGIIAPLLGWDAQTSDREVQAFRDSVTAELAGEEALDDAGAIAAVRAASTDLTSPG